MGLKPIAKTRTGGAKPPAARRPRRIPRDGRVFAIGPLRSALIDEAGNTYALISTEREIAP